MAGAAIVTVAGLAPAQADDKVEKVTVTGSRIPQKGLTSISPVSTITSTEAKLQGTTSAETLLNNLPQVFANQGAQASNGTSGTSTVDLRALGPKRTLVLVNGKRMHPANLLAPTADLNTIPMPLLERVEVLTGGASAVYGADAVAGVVNFILRKNFEGLEVGGQVQEYVHTNDDAVMRALLTANHFSTADKNTDDGRTLNLWGIMGANVADGKGNVSAYLQYRYNQPVLQSERDFSGCAISDIPGNPRLCRGSSNGPTGKFTIKNPGLVNFGFVDAAGNLKAQRFTASSTVSGAFRPFAGTDLYNFSPTNYLIRPDERYLLGAMAHYDLAPDLEAYAETSYMEDNTTGQIAASGFFGGSGPVTGGNYLLNCDNPFLQTGVPTAGSTQVTPFNALCGNLLASVSAGVTLAAPLGTTGTATIDLGRRFFESNLGRQDIFKTESYRLVGGLRGQIEDWDYDVSAQYGSASTPRVYANDVSRTRASRGLLVILDPRPLSPTFGQPICQSVLDGTDPTCVPINIFTNGQLTPAAIAYASGTGIRTSTTKETIINASATGEVGVASPWAHDNVGLAVGGEYRLSSLQAISDDVFSSGDLLGQGGSTPNIFGHYDVWEGFGEIQIPLVQDAPFAKSIEVNAGYRISDYDNNGITHTYKYGASWMPTDDFRVRGSFQRAVRAPNVIELFTPRFQGTFAGRDLCAGTTSTSNFAGFTAAQCATGGTGPGQSGVTLAQYNALNGGGLACTSSQCAGTFGGNPHLKPESSDTKSFGVVFTPTFVKGFTASVDYYDIFIDAAIQVQNGNVIQVECYKFHLLPACALIHRDASSALLDTSTLGAGVSQLVQNIGSQATSGVDYQASYRFDLDAIGLNGAGGLSFNLNGTYTQKLENTNGPGFQTFDCAGLFGVICGLPVPKNKHTLRSTWATPWDIDLSLGWRHMSSVDLDMNTDDPVLGATKSSGGKVPRNGSIKAYDYLDVSFQWPATDYLSITGGVNNVTDLDPPTLDSNIFGISAPPLGNGNTYPVVYDSMGRQVFITVTSKF